MLELERFNDLILRGELRSAFVVGSTCELSCCPLSLTEEDGLALDPATWLVFFRKFMALHAALKEHELARYLWRRSPPVLKNDAEYEVLWRVNRLSLMDTTAAMKLLLTTEWSPDIQPLMKIIVQVFSETQFQSLSLLHGIEAAQQPREFLIYNAEDDEIWNMDGHLTPFQEVSTAPTPEPASLMSDIAEYIAHIVRKPPTIDLKSADKSAEKKTGRTIVADPTRK